MTNHASTNAREMTADEQAGIEKALLASGTVSQVEVQTAIAQATNFDAQNLEYARDLLTDLNDDYPDNETIVAQWFRKVRTETILAAGPAPAAQASPVRVDDHMIRARRLVENHIEAYGMVPHPDRIKEAIAEMSQQSFDLGFRAAGGIAPSVPSAQCEGGK